MSSSLTPLAESRTLPVALPVALASCPDYVAGHLTHQVGGLFSRLGYHPSRGEKILVKPNLLRADPTGLSCTHPALVRAACAYLLDHGAVVTIADSPGFGTARGVAKATGLTETLQKAPELAAIPIRTLDDPVFVPLVFDGKEGGKLGLSRQALEADSILNLPRLKAHAIMRISGAVKNLYGCICGMRKALMHAVHGDKDHRFSSMILDIPSCLPPVMTLMDAVTAMHVTGPSGGEPFQAGLLAASPSPLALDTVVYGMLGLTPEEVPLWEDARRRQLPGSMLEDIEHLGNVGPDFFDLRAFRAPKRLVAQSFSPPRLLKSAVCRLWNSLRHC